MDKKITIGINRRVTVGALDMALSALLSGDATPEYFLELAKTECSGENRAKKMVSVLNRLTIKNPIAPYVQEHVSEVTSMKLNGQNKKLLYVAIISSAYEIAYDIVALMGKYFHVQTQVGRELVMKKLAEKYGSNHSLVVAFDCVVPLLIEVGFVSRPKPGIYEMTPIEGYSEAAKEMYTKAFLLNNPNISSDSDIEGHSFFEFIK